MTTRNERIAQAMRDAGFETQTALSRAAGVPQPTISRICSSAHSMPDTTTLQKIANACGVSVQWLLEGTGTPLPPATAPGDEPAPGERLYCEPDPFEGIELERQKFEAWATGKSGPWLPEALARDEFGYKSTEVREHWSMWVELATRRISTALAQSPRLPKTGVKVTDITQVQRDLARHAASGNAELAATCVRVQAVIEGLLSGLDAEQLA